MQIFTVPPAANIHYNFAHGHARQMIAADSKKKHVCALMPYRQMGNYLYLLVWEYNPVFNFTAAYAFFVKWFAISIKL